MFMCLSSENPPWQRGKEGRATVVAEPSGGCLDRLAGSRRTTPQALRDRVKSSQDFTFAPPPFLRGNIAHQGNFHPWRCRSAACAALIQTVVLRLSPL